MTGMSSSEQDDADPTPKVTRWTYALTVVLVLAVFLAVLALAIMVGLYNFPR